MNSNPHDSPDEAKHSSESHGAAPLIWIWQTLRGKYARFHVACLTDAKFFLRADFSRQKWANELHDKLQAGIPPDEAFSEKTAAVVSLDQVAELRCGCQASVVEIDGPAQKSLLSFDTEKNPIYRDIYEAVRKQVAPRMQPGEGHLSTGSSIEGPIVGIFFSIIVGAVLIPLAALSDADDEAKIAGKGLLEGLLERPLAVLGVTGTIILTLLLLVATIGWLVYRAKHPLPAFVVRTDREERA